MNSMKRLKKNMTLKDELPGRVGAHYATGKNGEIAKKLQSYLSQALVQSGRFDVMERSSEEINKLSEELKIDKYTLQDIIDSLIKPNRDPRDMLPKPLLKKDILHLEDLRVGMKLQGTVRNVVDFGAFIDIGIKNDGLVHISKMTDKFIKHPSEVVSVGQIIEVYVDDINLEKQKVSLSMKEVSL